MKKVERIKFKPTTKKQLEHLINRGVYLGDIDTSLITDMSYLFCMSKMKAYRYRGISTWNVSNVKNFKSMFELAENFNENISMWNMENAENISCMFYYNKSFNQDLSSWNVSNVKDCHEIFSYSNYNHSLEEWNFKNIQDLEYAFFYSKIERNGKLPKWYIESEFYKNLYQKED